MSTRGIFIWLGLMVLVAGLIGAGIASFKSDSYRLVDGVWVGSLPAHLSKDVAGLLVWTPTRGQCLVFVKEVDIQVEVNPLACERAGLRK